MEGNLSSVARYLDENDEWDLVSPMPLALRFAFCILYLFSKLQFNAGYFSVFGSAIPTFFSVKNMNRQALLLKRWFGFHRYASGVKRLLFHFRHTIFCEDLLIAVAKVCMWLKNYNHTPTAPTSTFIFMQDFYTFLCIMVSLSHSCPLHKPVDRFICILAATLMQFKEWGRGGLELNPLPKHEIAPHCVTHLFERPMHQIDLTPMDLLLRPKEVAEFLNA